MSNSTSEIELGEAQGSMSVAVLATIIIVVIVVAASLIILAIYLTRKYSKLKVVSIVTTNLDKDPRLIPSAKI
jgi:heme/copper-type cytochrome/quinol oxidase subunit 4